MVAEAVDFGGLNKTVTSGGGPREYIVKSKSGDFENVEIDERELESPRAGFYPQIELRGISKTFQMESQFKPGTTQTMVRLLFKVVGQQAAFSQMFNFESVSPKSQLGMIFNAIRKQDIVDGEQLDNAFWGEVIGGRFGAMIHIDAKQGADGQRREYAKVLKGSVVEAEDAPKGKKNALLDDED